METENKDIMRELFAGLPDESLPFRFDDKVMERIHREASLRVKRNKRLEVLGYVSGGAAMIAICIFIQYYMGVSFELPKINLSMPTFTKPEFSFDLNSFGLSLYIGIIALFLLIIDSTVRRRLEKTKEK